MQRNCAVSFYLKTISKSLLFQINLPTITFTIIQVLFKTIYFIHMSSISVPYVLYDIAGPGKNYAVTVSSQKSISNVNSHQRGAYKPARKEHSAGRFVDPNFSLGLKQRDTDFEGNPLKERRISDFYENQFEIFQNVQAKDVLLNKQNEYPSFISEYVMIDRDYARTLFITKNVNKSGFYEYFVRRNGEYFVEVIDDVIPVSNEQQEPIWGLSIKQPWKLLLMKAWIKEKKGIEGVLNAQPFEFIEAFGFPGYRVFSLKKEINFLSQTSLSEESKQKKAQKFPFHLSQYNVFGKTKSHIKVKEYGLELNRLGYKISSLKKQQNILLSSIKASNSISEGLFKVQNFKRAHWFGNYSVAEKQGRINNLPVGSLQVQRQFIATYQQISELFSKFYAVRKYNPIYKVGESKISSNSTKFIEHSLNHKLQNDSKLGQFYRLVVTAQGHLNINVQVPNNPVWIIAGKKGEAAKRRYPPIKLLLGIQSKDKKVNLQDYVFYDGDYVKGYHKLNSRFIMADPGTYLLYVKVDTSQFKTDSYAVNINGNAQISKFELQTTFDQQKKSNAFRSILYTYAIGNLIKIYPTKQEKEMVIYIGNTFDEIGFGVIALNIKDKKSNRIFCAKVYSDVLAKSNIILSREAHEITKDFQCVAKYGENQVIVMEKTDRKSFVESQFPPEGSFKVFQVYDHA